MRMGSNEILDALSTLAGRTVTRDEVADVLGISVRTTTRYGHDTLANLKIAKLQLAANHYEVSLVRLLLQLGLITEAEVMEAADGLSPHLTEATPLELAERLVELLRRE